MNEPTLQKPPRVWPGVLIVFLQWVARYGVPHFVPEALPFGVVSGFAGGLLVVVWWVFVSRAPWSERVGAVVLMVIALAATPRFLDVSMATAGQGMLFYMYAIPFLSLAFVAWAVATRRRTGGARWVSMAATILLACGVWTLLRTGGITGDVHSDFAWRWSKTSEERLLAHAPDEMAEPTASATATEADWPGFRGPRRDGVIPGVRIETDWSKSPPVELWRRPIDRDGRLSR